MEQGNDGSFGGQKTIESIFQNRRSAGSFINIANVHLEWGVIFGGVRQKRHSTSGFINIAYVHLDWNVIFGDHGFDE